MCSAKCFLEVHNGGSGNNRIRQVVPVAYDSIAELILCNVTLKLRGLKFKTVTSGGDRHDVAIIITTRYHRQHNAHNDVKLNDYRLIFLPNYSKINIDSCLDVNLYIDDEYVDGNKQDSTHRSLVLYYNI